MHTKRTSITVSNMIVWAFIIFAAGCTGETPAPEVGQFTHLSPASLRTDASKLQGTIVTAHLDQEIPEGKNVLWCATFQLAWNELMDYAGGPVTMPKPPAMVEALNRRQFTKSGLDSDSYVALAGNIADGTLQRAKEQLARKFPGTSPELLPTAEGFPPDAVMLYAFMARQLPFQYAFRRLDCLRFGASHDWPASDSLRQASFGIYQYLCSGKSENDIQRKQARQIRILSHSFGRGSVYDRSFQQFVVELLTTSSEDRLLLAAIPPEETFGQTVAEAMRLIKNPNTLVLEEPFDSEKLSALSPEESSRYACLLPLESCVVSVLDFDICREYAELLGQNVQAKSLKVNGLPFVFAKQQIRFRLDETGAKLKSEALGFILSGPPRDFTFDRPFLIMLLRKGATQPYFALWVGNSELLVKAPAH